MIYIVNAYTIDTHGVCGCMCVKYLISPFPPMSNHNNNKINRPSFTRSLPRTFIPLKDTISVSLIPPRDITVPSTKLIGCLFFLQCRYPGPIHEGQQLPDLCNPFPITIGLSLDSARFP